MTGVQTCALPISKRSAHDAIEQCFKVLAGKHHARWVLEGDIKSCFDKISHEWLIKHANMDKEILRKWLKAGYIENEAFHQTEEGTPQGGIISPTLANIALDGLEAAVKKAVPKGNKIHFVRYADDFIVTATSEKMLEEIIRPIITNFLEERGLELSIEKTKITHIDEGFDFLGFNIRKYGGKLLIKPAKKGVKTFLDSIRKIIKSQRAVKTEVLIYSLNRKIRGWVNFYRHCVAKETFSYVDHCIFQAIWKWTKRRHSKKNTSWIRKRYFTQSGLANWCFYSIDRQKDRHTHVLLNRASQMRIQRHVKVRSEASPYDPDHKGYFIKRNSKKMRT